MRVMKFGGSSIGTPEKAKGVINIIKAVTSSNTNVAVVLSAFGKSTDQLVEMGRMHQLQQIFEPFCIQYFQIEDQGILKHWHYLLM